MAARRGRGEGTIEQLPSGKWRAVLPGRSKAGRTKSFPSKAEALEWLRRHADQRVASAGTLGGWLDEWLVLHQGRVARHTYLSDRSIVSRHIRPVLGAVRIRDLSALRIEAFLAGLKGLVSADMRHKIAKTLRNVLNAAVRPGNLFSTSPMTGVKMPPIPRPQTRALTPDELGRVLRAADQLGHGVMFRVWTELGLRPGELLGLRWEDFDGTAVAVVRTMDPTTNEPKPPKTAREAPIPLSPALAIDLAELRAGRTGVMFPTTRGGGAWWRSNFLDFVWRPVMRLAGVKPGPNGRYVIRHTTASLLLSEGVSVIAVSKRLGHSTPDFTLRRYAHLMPTDQEKATVAIGRTIGALLSPRTHHDSP